MSPSPIPATLPRVERPALAATRLLPGSSPCPSCCRATRASAAIGTKGESRQRIKITIKMKITTKKKIKSKRTIKSTIEGASRNHDFDYAIPKPLDCS
jgi:hypothetical protein